MKIATLLVGLVLVLGACKDKGGGEGTSAAASLQKMAELKDEMCKCKDAKCAQDVSEQMTKWSQEQAKNQKQPPKMSEADTKKAGEIGEALGKCMQEAMAATATPSDGTTPPAEGGGADAAGGADGLPTECADYKQQVEKLRTCDKLPPKAKDALVKAFDDAAAGWASMPEGAKAGLGTSCKAGSEAIVAAAKEACGW
jgi:hypothetical protein